MKTYQLVVIGSGPGGVNAADSYVEAGGEGPVLLLTAERVAPYERPPLSKESLREAGEPQPVPLGKLTGVEVRLGATVTRVDTGSRTVEIADEVVGFNKLVIASGGRSKHFPSDDESELYYLRSYNDLLRLREAASHARTAVVIGSGFIGCEAAVSLAMRGIAVTVVSPERLPQADRLGAHAAGVIAEILRSYGIDLRTGTGITQVRAPRTLHLSDGTTLEPDLILAAVGSAPATAFLDDGALQMHHGSVVVDRHMQTLVEGVYAVGDAARAEHAIAGRPVPVEHWGDAEAIGRVAGTHAAGQDAEWREIPGFWTDLGEHALQYAAWGDGYDELQVIERAGGFAVWYGGADGALVGVLTYNADDDYERGRQLLEQGASFAAAVRGDRPEDGTDTG